MQCFGKLPSQEENLQYVQIFSDFLMRTVAFLWIQIPKCAQENTFSWNHIEIGKLLLRHFSI